MLKITRDELHQLYIIENKSIPELSEIYSCSIKSIRNYLKKYNIVKDDNLNKEKLYQLYIIENKTRKEISKILNCSIDKISCYLSKYNIEKDQSAINDSIKKTLINKYGVSQVSEIPGIQEKKKKTYLERYGYEHSTQNPLTKERMKKTNLERYNAEYPSQNPLIKNKIEETTLKNFGVKCSIHNNTIKEKIHKNNLLKYGHKHHFSNSVIKEKIKKTNLLNYGFNVSTKNPQVKRKIYETKMENNFLVNLYGKTPKEWAIEYNIPPTSLYKWLSKNNPSKDDVINYCLSYKEHLTNIENIILQNLKLERYNKFVIPTLKYKPDFKIQNNKYFNTDGLYWHSELKKENKYHFNMRKEFEQNNLRLFQFRENEIFEKFDIIKSMINNTLNQTEFKIGARKTKVSIVNSIDAELFLNQNHIKGYKNAKHLGLYYQNELVSIMSYKLGKNKLEQFIKIERFCSKVSTNVIGGFSKLLKAIEATYQVKYPIYYWVDLRYGTGDFLLNHNFKLERETLGWEWTDGLNTYNRLKCRANMDERKLTEKEHADELGWYKIYDAGQRLYISVNNAEI